ncbi:MAG TPA: YggS family pyridoxal phosphate-dependent enzyme [Bryobacterales bacterium]|nr:YggS family pyridoxal phosphate-dependent enzyme [Bryobacterales bacterium]
MIAEALARVEERIQAAAARAGRRREQITLIGVSKVMPAAAICEAYQAGLRHFGENYVQEFASKSKELGPLPGAVFHMIGHLQSNKAGVAAELFDVIQTVDNARLARRLSQAGKRLRVLIEVKLSPEETKTGVDENELPALLDAVRGLDPLELRGLMVMPPWPKNPEDSRPYFQRLRALAAAHKLPDLSMGMSGDFEVAIEEGATLIRVGTAIFGSRKAHA